MTARKAPFSHALLGLLLLVGAAQGMAQSLIPGMKSGASSQAAAQSKAGTDADSLDAHIKDVQQRLAKLQSQVVQVPPPGANDVEWDKYQLMQTSEARSLTAHVNALRNLAEERRTEEDRAASRKAWKGFGQKPPYDVALVDDWWAQVRRIEREIEATQVEQRLVDNMFEQEKKTLKTAQQAKRQADEQLLTSDDPAQAARLRWLAELARVSTRYSETRVGLLETLRSLLAEKTANQQAQRQWLEEKAEQASRSLVFSQQELDTLLAKLAEQSHAIAQQSAQAEKEEHQAQNELARIRALATAHPATDYQQQLETARAEADAADGRLSSLRLMSYGISLMQQTWQQRFQTMQTRDSHSLQQTSGIIESYLGRAARMA